jgi:hypothetical protein
VRLRAAARTARAVHTAFTGTRAAVPTAVPEPSTGPLDGEPGRPYRRRGRREQTVRVQPTDDPALDDALARISELSSALLAVRDLHAPRARAVRRPVCRACGHAFPCPTARVSG